MTKAFMIICLAAAVGLMTADAQDLLFTKDGKGGINALPASENRWKAQTISAGGMLNDVRYHSLTNLDFFVLEYGEGFPESGFDTTGTNVFRRVFGYSKKEGGAGIRFGRGWGACAMSHWGIDIEIDQSDDTEWQLTFNKVSGWTSNVKFKIPGKGRVKLSKTLGIIAKFVKDTEVSGLELSCLSKNVRGSIRTFRLVPRVVPILWRRKFSLPDTPVRAGLSMKNYPSFTLHVNGRIVRTGFGYEGREILAVDLTDKLSGGSNEVVLETEAAAGYSANLWFFAELFAVSSDGTTRRFDTSDKPGTWEWSADGIVWSRPKWIKRAGSARYREIGEVAEPIQPLHAGAIDVVPDEVNGYPVFDADRSVRWIADIPKGVKDPELMAKARQTLAADGRLIDAKVAPTFSGKAETGAVTFGRLPVGAYEITWRLVSGKKIVDTLKNEMVVCGPLGLTEVAYGDFEKTLEKRLRMRQEVDCACENVDPTRFLDHSGPFEEANTNVGRVVDLGGGIRARETGKGEGAFFSYKLETGRLGAPHILEADIPDVREQTVYCWINESFPVGFCNNMLPEGSRSWPNATGAVTCGGVMPISGSVKKLRVVFFPGSKNITVSFEKGKRGGAAAVCGFRVYEVEGGLPALKVPKTDRRYGNHNERPVYAAWGTYVNPCIHNTTSGLYPNVWTAAFAAALNRTMYLRYCGHNASIEGAYMYESGFPTLSGESNSMHPEFDFRYPLLKLYRHNGIHTFLGFEYMRSPIFIGKGLLDVSDRQVQAGTARTVYVVRRDGRQNVGYMGNGINFLNHEVRQSMANLLGEIYSRYAPIGGIEGLFVVNGGWWLPGIVTSGKWTAEDLSYDDDTIEIFERETGICLDSGWSGKDRFMRRHELLTGRYADVWYGWRAKKLREAIDDLQKVVRQGANKWRVYPSGTFRMEPINPFSRLGCTAEERMAYEARRRKVAGFPVELYGEGSGSGISLIPISEFGREVYMENYGLLFNPGAAAIRWKNDAAYYTCGPLNEHWSKCPAAKQWWWRTNGVNVYDVKQCGENAFFDLVETTATYAPKFLFHSWTDVNVTSGHADECRRFVTGFYATPLDRRPVEIRSVKGIQATRYGDSIRLINATPWGVRGWVDVGGGREDLEIPPYGVVVRASGETEPVGEFQMAAGCPHHDFASARKAMDYETMRDERQKVACERNRPNQERFLAALAKDGIARINAGCFSAIVDEEGAHWLPDQAYMGRNAYGNEFVKAVNRGTVRIARTKSQSIYRTEAGGGSDFIAYHFPVPKGRYRLVCHVAETWDTSPGRVMDVTVNGQKRKVDTWELCGGRLSAAQFSFEDIDVPEGGEIRYESVNRPIVSAFEIVRVLGK